MLMTLQKFKLRMLFLKGPFWFLLSLTLLLSACMPKATQSTANCGITQAFDPVTRSCYSISEIRYTPSASLSSVSLSQETAQLINLTYFDRNGDKAKSCAIDSTSIANNLYMASPILLDGSIYSIESDLYGALSDLNTVLNNYHSSTGNVTPAELTTVATYLSNINNDNISAKNSYYLTTKETLLGDINDNANKILTLIGNSYLSDSSISYYYNIASTINTTYFNAVSFVKNKCYCTGGVCTTYALPKKGQSGPSGFSYTITDIDGPSVAKNVTATIASMSKTAAHLRPVAPAGYITHAESNSIVPVSFSFTIPQAADYFSNSTFSYSSLNPKTGNYIVSDSGYGKITGCLGLGGSAANSLNCTYTPNSGDANSTSTPAAAKAIIDDLTYTAATDSVANKGTSGNNIKIFYKDISTDITSVDNFSTTYEKFGLISGTDEVYVRVYGDYIYVIFSVGTTTTEQIANAINTDPVAKKLVSVSSGTPNKATLNAASGTNLSGGVGGFDSFSYSVSNGSLGSINTSKFEIQITPTDDPPLSVADCLNAGYGVGVCGSNTTAVAMDEDSVSFQLVTLKYYDVDGPITGATCSISNLIGLNIAKACSCDNLGVCTVGVIPIADFFGTASFDYAITTNAASPLTTTHLTTVSFAVNSINDKPVFASSDNNPVIISERMATPPYPTGTYSFTAGSGNTYENQSLTITAVSSNTNIISDYTTGNKCYNYVAGSGAPTGTATGLYYDVQNHICYYAVNGTWAEYPNLTVIPDCNGTTNYGQGAPGAGTSTTSGYYLDTTNNSCYSYTGGVWTNKFINQTMPYHVVFSPNLYKSSTSPVTVTLTIKDDGGTANGGVDTITKSFDIKVNAGVEPPKFLTTISSVATNEGGTVIAGPFKVDEDLGGSNTHDGLGIKLTSITSSDQSILPDSGIKIFYDSNDNGVYDTGEERTSAQYLETSQSDDSAAHNFYLILKPVGGVSGNANITITADNGNGSATLSTATTTFSLVVNPVAAIHGGWSNITAVGIKTDKFGNPVSASDIVCNYNKTSDLHKCSGSNCTGTSTPVGVITPDAANVLYWDSANSVCYRSTGITAYTWVSMKTTCPITRTVGVCSGENCIVSSTPTAANLSASAANQYAYDTTAKACYQSYQTGMNGNIPTYDWTAYTPAKVTLNWKTFTISGTGSDMLDSIKGYNVYRRTLNTDYDLNNPIGSVSGVSTLTFTDSTANSGNLYFYSVRPIDTNHNIATYTPEIFSEIRVIAPPPNYAFVHRWMINQEICNKMHMTTTTANPVDPTHNFRCPYVGPGGIGGYYDYGQDLLVDISEMGCPYTLNTLNSNHCSVGTNGCIGMTSASSQIFDTGPTDNDIYYDRSSGTCSVYKSGAWVDYDTAAKNLLPYGAQIAASKTLYSTALNPPLVNLSNASAVTLCQQRSAPTINNVSTLSTPSLPTKKDYMAYSAAPDGKTDSEIADLELGTSLNIVSRCNGSGADGLQSYYTDSSIPSSSYIYTIPGTYSSGIRSIYTGSVPLGYNFSTQSCVSRYGIQDIYGNVAQWVQDRMNCTTPFVCSADTSWAIGYDFGGNHIYGFDLITGPYNDSNGDSVANAGDSWLTSWDYKDMTYSAGKFSFPVAMPINTDIATALPTSTALPFILSIGTSAGITTDQLHGDAMIVNAETVYNNGKTGAFAVGGSYLSGARSGRYTSELIPLTDNTRKDVGFRCIVPVPMNNYPNDSIHPYKNSY